MKRIDTPFGPYAPQGPSPQAMARAAGGMSHAVEAIAALNHDVWACCKSADRLVFDGRPLGVGTESCPPYDIVNRRYAILSAE